MTLNDPRAFFNIEDFCRAKTIVYLLSVRRRTALYAHACMVGKYIFRQISTAMPVACQLRPLKGYQTNMSVHVQCTIAISIEIYSGIAQFPCNSTARLSCIIGKVGVRLSRIFGPGSEGPQALPTLFLFLLCRR